MKSLIIFGTGDIAELANYYFSCDSQHAVAAFTVDDAFVDRSEFCGVPVVPFSEVSNRFPPKTNNAFVALSYSKLNQTRKTKYLEMKSKGYRLVSYISSKATVLNNNKVGENCFILEDNTVQPFVTIGNNVTLWSGNHIGHHSTIADHNFIASHVVVSGGVKIGEACFIGVNATLRDHICIGENCIIGAGALLLTDAEPNGVYIGSATERSKASSSRIKNL